jgi:hypothetical protein
MSNNGINRIFGTFLAGYVLFYVVMRFSFSMQTGVAVEVPANWLLTGIFGFGNAFLPYYCLQKYYPSLPLLKMALLLMCMILITILLQLLLAQFLLSFSFNQFIDASYQLLLTLSFYGIGFYFIRYSHLKKVQTKESEIREREKMVTLYQKVFPEEQIFHQLKKIEEAIQNDPSAALREIEQFSNELQQILYSLNDPRNE